MQNAGAVSGPSPHVSRSPSLRRPKEAGQPCLCLYTARKTAMIFFTGRYARNSLIPLAPTS
jgi:hypothetical protein